MFYTDLENEPKYGTDEHKAWNALRRREIESQVGEVWDTSELAEEFNIEGFFGPGFCYGTRKGDSDKLTLQFTHSPRFYYNLRYDK